MAIVHGSKQLDTHRNVQYFCVRANDSEETAIYRCINLQAKAIHNAFAVQKEKERKKKNIEFHLQSTHTNISHIEQKNRVQTLPVIVNGLLLTQHIIILR